MRKTTWYDMYEYENNYAKYNEALGVTSEMIWGSQWDQMMIFVNGKGDGEENAFYVAKTGSRNDKTLSITGGNSKDQVANIFDLEASWTEWTMEIGLNYNKTTETRINRGDSGYTSSGLASSRYNSTLPGEKIEISGRMTLFVDFTT